MKSGRGETFPCKWNAKSSTVCACVCECICRSSWELRRSVSTTTKVPTKGFPISFNGALIATEGMEQPDERERVERRTRHWGGGGEKRRRGIRRDNPGSKRFSIDDGATDSLRSFHRVPIIDTLASSCKGLCRAPISLERYEVALNRRLLPRPFSGGEPRIALN